MSVLNKNTYQAHAWRTPLSSTYTPVNCSEVCTEQKYLSGMCLANNTCLMHTHLQSLHPGVYSGVVQRGAVLDPDTRVVDSPQGPHEWLGHLHLHQVGLKNSTSTQIICLCLRPKHTGSLKRQTKQKTFLVMVRYKNIAVNPSVSVCWCHQHTKYTHTHTHAYQ